MIVESRSDKYDAAKETLLGCHAELICIGGSHENINRLGFWPESRVTENFRLGGTPPPHHEKRLAKKLMEKS